MAFDGGDLKRRQYGFLFFLPILLPVLAGYPYIIFGTALAALWVGSEAVRLLSFQLSSQRRYLSLLLILFIFILPLSLPADSSALVLACLGAAGIMFLLAWREPVFVAALAATVFSLSYLSVQPQGYLLIILIACLITASDVGAYFCGRLFGGPKLAAALSPSKTWSGSIGGVMFSLLTAEFLIYGVYNSHLDVYAGAAVVFVTVLSQAGDLFESGLKRRLNIKDSSQFVPGHGGALDRFDGYLFVLPVIAAVSCAGGMAAFMPGAVQ